MLIFYEFTYLLSYILIISGLTGLLLKRGNLVISLICIEMSILGVALLFVLNGLIVGNSIGDITFFFLLTLAGVESALGLSIIILYYKGHLTTKYSALSAIKG